MNHYDYQKTMRTLWEHAVATYQSGNRNPDSYFDKEQLAWMQANGLKVMDLYDFAEDFVSGGEPDFETFLMVHAVRRDYFLQEMNGNASETLLDVGSIPAKDASVEGIVWLPRIMPKARAKLRGELGPEIMYGCGGDRRFFKTNDIHPAEFLRVVWSNFEDESSIVDWVKARANG
jgi:hypothetical protein